MEGQHHQIRVVPTPNDHGGGSHANIFIEGCERRVACVYPWYGTFEQHDRLLGYAWMTLPESLRHGIPRVLVPKSDVVPTFDDAVAWAKWYIEEGPR